MSAWELRPRFLSYELHNLSIFFSKTRIMKGVFVDFHFENFTDACAL